MILNKINSFNIILAGYGGQGILTLAEILSQAAISSGYDVKQAELHGLAQRGGSLECHIRLGEKIYSPLISQGEADLIIGLELLETLRASYYANKNKTVILANNYYFSPQPLQSDSSENLLRDLKKFAQQLYLIEASQILLANNLSLSLANTFVLGSVLTKNVLPLKREIVWQAIVNKLKPQFLSNNQKAFDLAINQQN